MENVRAHLRIVSRTGHSHAESMCAWPTATTWCALAEAGRRARGQRRAAGGRGAGDVVRVDDVEHPLRACRISARRWRLRRQLPHQPLERYDVPPAAPHREVQQRQLAAAELVEQVRPGRRRSPYGVGEKRCSPSTLRMPAKLGWPRPRDRGRPAPAASSGTWLLYGDTALIVAPVRAPDQTFGLEARVVLEAQVDHELDRVSSAARPRPASSAGGSR